MLAVIEKINECDCGCECPTLQSSTSNVQGSDATDSVCWVECESCGEMGPEELTEWKAVEMWNQGNRVELI